MSKLAIVIPYYKIDFFEETLQSVATQSNRDFVVYIGNDASPDDPLPLIEKYLRDFSYFYFDYKDNLGGKNLALQWERILKNVKEDWFQILGDDDIISEKFVEEFYKNIDDIQQQQCNVIKYKQCWVNENNSIIRDYTSYPKIMEAWECWSKKYLDGNQSSLSEHIFRTEIYRKKGFVHLPLAWGTDDLAVLEFANGQPIYFIENAHVSVRISTENISGKKDNISEKEAAIVQLHDYLLKKHFKNIPLPYFHKIIDGKIRSAFKNKQTKLNIPLFKIYFSRKQYLKILQLPQLYFYLYKNK